MTPIEDNNSINQLINIKSNWIIYQMCLCVKRLTFNKRKTNYK